MKLLCICEPSHYNRPALEIPIFYQRVAQDKRVDFFHTSVDNVLKYENDSGKIRAVTVPADLDYEKFLHLNSQTEIEYNLEDFNLVFCRTLKPFPTGYLDKLGNWEKFTRFVNKPTSKKQQTRPEFLLKSSDYTPELIVTSKTEEIETFLNQHQTIVAKQNNSCGGKGIFKISHQGDVFQVDNLLKSKQEFIDFTQVMNYILGTSNEQIQFMQYLSGVTAGDKRIVVVDGDIYGAYIRRSQSGNWVNNVSGDGECYLAPISEEEKIAINNTVSHYRNLDLFTLGYDFLLDEKGVWRISEINAGNVGGFARLEILTGKPILHQFISWLIEFADAKKATSDFAISQNSEYSATGKAEGKSTL